MNSSFPTIGSNKSIYNTDGSFWPSFTDIMMVITLIFLMATSLLVVRNWQLVDELQVSVAAELEATQIIESTTMENATLEERLTNAEQSNSILRLRVLKKDEELKRKNNAMEQQESRITSLQIENSELGRSLEQANAAIAVANLELDAATAQYQELVNQFNSMSQQLAEQKTKADLSSDQLATAQTKILNLTQSSVAQEKSIMDLISEKARLGQEVALFNQQIATLKEEYRDVKAKYDDLIRPARSAIGKYIVQVYYIKGKDGQVIRFKLPEDTGFTELSLPQVEKRLDKLKAQKGDDLYVKIIIPEDSDLSYTEAWEFMRKLLAKYDYYYQDN